MCMICKELTELPSSYYILWADYGTEGWQPLAYATLDEALNNAALGVGLYGCVITRAPVKLTER